jgi:hypothetical protein
MCFAKCSICCPTPPITDVFLNIVRYTLANVPDIVPKAHVSPHLIPNSPTFYPFSCQNPTLLLTYILRWIKWRDMQILFSIAPQVWLSASCWQVFFFWVGGGVGLCKLSNFFGDKIKSHVRILDNVFWECFLQNSSYFERKLWNVATFRYSIHGGRPYKEWFWKHSTAHLEFSPPLSLSTISFWFMTWEIWKKK